LFETHITIGNFYDDANTDTLCYDMNNPGCAPNCYPNSYYYIDDVTVMLATGIGENEQQNIFTVYPNPANENIVVEFKKPFTGNLTLTDINGKIHKSVFIKNTVSYKIPVEDIAPGYYLLRLENAEGVFTNKVVVMR
jgi:hypothetical protein